MSPKPGRAYWGARINVDVTKDAKEFAGAEVHPCGIDEDLFDARNERKNAKQIVATTKGSFNTDAKQIPEQFFPGNVDQRASDEPNAYSDGSLTNPTTQLWAVGGFWCEVAETWTHHATVRFYILEHRRE